MFRRSFLHRLASLPAAGILARLPLAAQGGINVTLLADKLHLLSGAGGNIAILEGPDGLLLIDSGLGEATEGILGATGKIGKGKITRLINTHWHYDHTGGNARLGKDGVKIVAQRNVLTRLSSKQTIAFFNRTFDPLPPEGLPVETFTDKGELQHGGESVRYLYLPPAHTDGDTVIHFQNANVFHGGDLLFNGMYPFIDYWTGGSLAGMAGNAERIWKMVDGQTKIIPGHGPMWEKPGVREYADMLAGSLEIMTKALKEGKTLEQIQSAQPLKAYDEKWGKGMLKPEQWIALNFAGMTMRQEKKPA